MKAIAFYLPQFHVIPENEAIYGAGFTEWDNVRQAVPLFTGHYQPHIPHNSLGYYNLLDENQLTLQHHMAYTCGVEAFCYYYYNFNGKRLLEKPLNIITNSTTIRNEFCLCWDHSSWYNNKNEQRSVFIEQTYSLTAAKALADDLVQYFSNPRYITIDGKPLFLVFAPERCPMIVEYAHVLREEIVKKGFPGICLAGVEAFVGQHPNAYTFDCMVEFAPSWAHENMLSAPDELPRQMDYVKTVQYMLSKDVPDYPRMRCVFPAWDNTPRRGAQGIACVNTSPEIFAVALEGMLKYTHMALPQAMQYTFINAWNEWGEGCHIEPDKRYGYQYLRIIHEVLRRYQ